jgi:hypothetical protein
VGGEYLSVLQLKSTLLKVFNTPINTLESMGSNGKNLVKEKYVIRTVGKNMVELYNIM